MYYYYMVIHTLQRLSSSLHNLHNSIHYTQNIIVGTGGSVVCVVHIIYILYILLYYIVAVNINIKYSYTIIIIDNNINHILFGFIN